MAWVRHTIAPETPCNTVGIDLDDTISIPHPYSG